MQMEGCERMTDYISREAFVEQKRKQYCEDCDRRKGMKNGKYKTLYEIGEAPCRACGIDDMLNDVEDFPAADVREVKRGKWYISLTEPFGAVCDRCGFAWSESIDAVKLEPSLSKIETPYCPNCGARMEEQT